MGSRTTVTLETKIGPINSHLDFEVDYRRTEAFPGDRETPEEPAGIEIDAIRLNLPSGQMGKGDAAELLGIDEDDLYDAIAQEILADE